MLYKYFLQIQPYLCSAVILSIAHEQTQRTSSPTPSCMTLRLHVTHICTQLRHENNVSLFNNRDPCRNINVYDSHKISRRHKAALTKSVFELFAGTNQKLLRLPNGAPLRRRLRSADLYVYMYASCRKAFRHEHQAYIHNTHVDYN